MKVCVDSSLVLSWILPTPESPASSILYQKWEREGVRVLAPSFLTEEVMSIIRGQVFKGRLTAEEGEKAFHLFLNLNLNLINSAELWLRAWELSGELNLPQVSSAAYLALAEIEDCELWMADKRSLGIPTENPRVRWAGEVFSEV
jgi:predicted nucleic acid-binding protein